MERFVQFLFSDSHLIGDKGTVKRLHKPSIKRYGTDVLVGLTKPDGYKMYFIRYKWRYAHRLVASHYITNPDNLSDVNHKDGNKVNNDVGNLEWCTHGYNIQHSYDVLNRTNPKGEAHHLYGTNFSQSTKDKMSLAKKGKKRKGMGGKWIKLSPSLSAS